MAVPAIPTYSKLGSMLEDFSNDDWMDSDNRGMSSIIHEADSLQRAISDVQAQASRVLLEINASSPCRVFATKYVLKVIYDRISGGKTFWYDGAVNPVNSTTRRGSTTAAGPPFYWLRQLLAFLDKRPVIRQIPLSRLFSQSSTCWQ